MPTREELFKQERIEFTATGWNKRRYEKDAEVHGQNLKEWCEEACNHRLNCGHFKPIQHLNRLLVPSETECVSCHDKIPAFHEIMYSSNIGALCPKCYVKRYGDKGRVAHIMLEEELQEDIRVLKIEKDELTKNVEGLNHDKKLDDIQNKELEIEGKLMQDLIVKDKEARDLEEKCIRMPYVTEEETKARNIEFERLDKAIDEIEQMKRQVHQQIEATQVLIKEREDFAERRFRNEYLKKRKRREEASEESDGQDAESKEFLDQVPNI